MTLTPKTRRFLIAALTIITSLLIIGAVTTDNFSILLQIIDKALSK